MQQIDLERYVDAPVERTFRVFADLQRTQGLDHAGQVELLTEGPLTQGTRWRETHTLAGWETHEELVLVDFDPPRGFTVETGAGAARYRSRFSFAADGQGTRVRVHVEVHARTLAARVVTVALSGLLRRDLRQDLAVLAGAAEQAEVVVEPAGAESVAG